MSTKQWVSAALLLAVVGVALFARTLAVVTHPVRVTSRDLGRYPDTGYLQWPHAQASDAGTYRIPVVSTEMLDSFPSPLARVDYVDTVHPDEDLLLGPDGATPIPAESDTPPAEPESDMTPGLPAGPTAEHPVRPPTTPPPRQQPRADTPPSTQKVPSRIMPTPTESKLNSDNALQDRETRRDGQDQQASPIFDPNIPPAPDEDLLHEMPAEIAPAETGPDLQRPEPPRENQQTGPIELLPNHPESRGPAPREVNPPATSAPLPPSSWPQATGPQSIPSMPPTTPPPPAAAAAPRGRPAPATDPHAAVFAESLYPSAKKCRECHQQIYDEWAMSSHAYAAISPMFQRFEQTITSLTRGTLGYFCMRCHAPIATALSFPRYASLIDAPNLPDSAREGVTCIACHRVREQYGKSNAERRIEPGDVHDPVYGSGDNSVLADVIRRKNEFKVKTDPRDPAPGLDIHRAVIQFPQLSDSSFCASCHQVFVAPGIELEVVWEQYRASPACKQGISCQDCHMGIEPGVAAGYELAPVAVVNNKPISPDRKHSNHSFHGPGYSIAHPGIFPFHKDAEKWSTETWLKFDWRSGWGSEEFENALDDGKFSAAFPQEWENSDDRYDAREVVDANLKTLLAKRAMRRRLYENSSHVEGPIFDAPAQTGRALKFHYVVSNLSNGHNMPSGSLGAQPQLWLNVALSGPNGQHLWESGYVDANGDICDVHSLEVAAGHAPRDLQLFNLQTKFLITHVKGTDREMYLPINTDIDQLPFIRPSAFPITVMNHPPFIRMEAHSIPALGSRKAIYKVPARLLQQSGQYRLTVRMRSRSEPIYFMRFCRATPEMERSMNEWMLDIHEHATDFWVP